MTFRPLPVMTVFTVISLIILIMLGNWQYGRYSDKLGRAETEPDQFEMVSVEVDTSNSGMAQQIYGIIEGEAVWRRYVPGRIDGQGPVVLVPWDATSGPTPVPLAIAETGEIERRSNVFTRRASQQGFGGSNQPSENIWYHYDGAAILANLGYEQDSVQVVEPDQLILKLADDVSRTRQAENPYATAQVRDPMPPQRHFGYALTWWGLAIVLVGVYAAFHHSRGRLRFRG